MLRVSMMLNTWLRLGLEGQAGLGALGRSGVEGLSFCPHQVCVLYAVCVVLCVRECGVYVCGTYVQYLWGGSNQAPYDLHGSVSLLPSWAPFSIKEKNYTFYFMTALCACVLSCFSCV